MSKVAPFPSNKVICIVNPRAARNKWKRRKNLRSYIQKSLPGKIIDVHGKKEQTIETVKKACLDHQIIVAVGGDGTVADVLQGIRESGNEEEILLGLIPFGSGNAFRKSLGIPKKVKKAIRLISDGRFRKIDLIDIEGRMAGFASIGAVAKVTQVKNQSGTPGLLGHLLASRIMFTLPRQNQEIELIDGKDDKGQYFEKKILKLKLFDCVIGKAKYFGYNWKIAPKARIDDGYLDVTLFEIKGWKYALVFPLMYFGIFQRTQKHFKAKKVIIRGKDLPLQYNGEFLGVRDKFELKVLPQALKIITR